MHKKAENFNFAYRQKHYIQCPSTTASSIDSRNISILFCVMVSHGNETSNSVCGEKERSVDRNKRRDIVKSAARRTIRPTLKMMKFEGNGPDGGTVSSTSRVKIKIDKTLEEGTGRWTHEENLQFLIGLKVVGVGQWNKLGGFCPKR